MDISIFRGCVIFLAIIGIAGVIFPYAIDTGTHINCSNEFLRGTTYLINKDAPNLVNEFKRLSGCIETKTDIVSPYIIYNNPTEYYRQSLIGLLENASSENMTITKGDIKNAYDKSLDILLLKLNNVDSISSDELLIFTPNIIINSSGMYINKRKYTNRVNIIYANNHSSLTVQAMNTENNPNNHERAGNFYKRILIGSEPFSVEVRWVNITPNRLSTDYGELVYSPSDSVSKIISENPGLNVSDIELAAGAKGKGSVYKIKVSEGRKLLWLINKKVEYYIYVNPQNLETKVEKPWWYFLTG